MKRAQLKKLWLSSSGSYLQKGILPDVFVVEWSEIQHCEHTASERPESDSEANVKQCNGGQSLTQIASLQKSQK